MSTTIVEVGPIPVELVNVEELSIDKRYQRAVRKPFVEQIGANWDWRQCGVLHVNERNGRKLVVDGQHRLLGARMAGIAAVPCLLMSDTATDEARLFVDLQEKRRGVTGAERHIALLAAKDQKALAVEAALHAAGCSIATTTSRISTNNAIIANKIYDRGGPDHLTDVFNVARKAWPFLNLPSGVFLNGLSVFLVTPFRHTVHLDRLAENLSHTTASAVTTAARETSAEGVLTIAKEITRIYNRAVAGTREGRAGLDVRAVQKGWDERRSSHLDQWWKRSQNGSH